MSALLFNESAPAPFSAAEGMTETTLVSMSRNVASLAICLVALLVLPAVASAYPTLYGSPGPEEEQLQAWIDSSHAPTPSIPVRLYEGNCNEGRPEGGYPPEENELELPEGAEEGGTVQTCAALTTEDEVPTAGNEAVYIPHMAWHPQYSAWWWHLHLLNEMGHVYDEVIGDLDRHREKFDAIYDYDPRTWWPATPLGTINVEDEKWAMAFSFCGYGAGYSNAEHLIENGEYSGFGFNPSPSEYARSCRLIDNLKG